MSSRAQETRAFQVGQATGIPINRPLVDNAKIGSFWTLLDRTVGTGDTVFTTGLGRPPSGYLVIANQAGGVVYDGATERAAWAPDSITVRATVAGTYSLLVF